MLICEWCLVRPPNMRVAPTGMVSCGDAVDHLKTSTVDEVMVCCWAELAWWSALSAGQPSITNAGSAIEPVGDCGSLVVADDVSSTLNDLDERRACHCSTSLPIWALARAASSGDGATHWDAAATAASALAGACWGGRRRRGGRVVGVCGWAVLRGRPRAIGYTAPDDDARVIRCSDLNSSDAAGCAGGGLKSRGGVNRICWHTHKWSTFRRTIK